MKSWITNYSSQSHLHLRNGADTCWGMDWWPCCADWQAREISWVWTDSDWEWDMTGYSMTSSHSPYPSCQSIHKIYISRDVYGTSILHYTKINTLHSPYIYFKYTCTDTNKFMDIFTPIQYQDILGRLSASAAVRRDEPCSDWSLKIRACFDWPLGAAWLDGLEGHGAHWVTGSWARTNGGHCTMVKFSQPGSIMR